MCKCWQYHLEKIVHLWRKRAIFQCDNKPQRFSSNCANCFSPAESSITLSKNCWDRLHCIWSNWMHFPSLMCYIQSIATLEMRFGTIYLTPNGIFFTNSSSWFQSTSPAYHLLHGHIEWRWIYLTICLRIEQDKLHQNLMISENTLRNTEFEEKLQLFLYDLILISAAKFNKVKRNLTSFTLSQLIQLLALSCIRQSCHWRAHSLARAWRKYGCWSSYWWNDFMKMAGS